MNDRTCIVTRECGSPENMIRFVAGPGGMVVPDVKGNLPGRGTWVCASRKMLEEAIKSKAFARGLKETVTVSSDLPDLVDALLLKSALAGFSMARRGGGVISGASKVESAIRNGDVIALLHAREAAEDGKRKIAQAVYAAQRQKINEIPVLQLFTGDEMSLAFGGNNVIHAAVLKGLAANGFIKKVQKLLLYRGESMMKRDEDAAGAAKEAETE